MKKMKISGIVKKRGFPKQGYKGLRFFMQLEDDMGNVLCHEKGEEYKIMVEIKDANDPWNQLVVGDKVSIKARNDASGWLNIKQDDPSSHLEILVKSGQLWTSIIKSVINLFFCVWNGRSRKEKF